MTTASAHKNISISLPKPIFQRLHSVSTTEYRSRSEIIRDLIRDHLIPSRQPTDEELAIFEYGEDAHARGLTIPLNQIPHGLRG